MPSKTRFFDSSSQIKIEINFDRKQKLMKVTKHCQVK